MHIDATIWHRWRRTREGLLFAVGITMVSLLIAEWILLMAFWPAAGRGILAGVTTEIFTGREAGISAGLTAGAPAILMFQYSAMQDLAAFFLGFPLFLYFLHRYHDSKRWWMKRLRRIEAAAKQHRKFIQRWGPLGLFFFMLIPFMINGPLAAGIIGRVAGVHTRYLVLPIVAATAVAAAAWTVALDWLTTLTSRLHPFVGPALVIALVGIAVASFAASELVHARRERRQNS